MGRPKPTKVEWCLFFCLIFYRISIDDLVIYAMGLKQFKDVRSMIQARQVIQDIINDLIARRLIKLSGETNIDETNTEIGECDNQFVEILNDGFNLAHLIASKYKLMMDHLAVRGESNYHNMVEYDGVSILLNSRNYVTHLTCPKLTTLQLRCKGTPALPTDLFRGMKKLRILSLVFLSLTQSFDGLKNLQTLHLKVVRLKDLSWVGGLKSLEFLCISTLSLRNIPKELGKLGNLRLLDLREMELVYIPPGVLSRLLKLEELYLPLSFRMWGCRVKEEDYSDDDGSQSRKNDDYNDSQKVNANLSDIASLKLSALQISAQYASLFPKKSPLFRTIQRFKILVHNDFEYQSNIKGPMNTMQLTGDAFDVKESAVNYLMWKAEDLRLIRVRNLKDVISQLDVNGFPHLKKMMITECDELEFLVSMDILNLFCSFAELKCLHMSMLPNLKEIWHGVRPAFRCFENLREINVRFCHKLKYVIPLSMAKAMRQLKRVGILDCHEMEGVFYRNEGSVDSSEIYFVEEIHLYSLPKFIGFIVDKEDTISGVQNGTNLPFIADEVSLNKNKEVSAFSSKLMKNGLASLKELKIAYCDGLEVIFSFEENQVTSQVLNSLKVLDLHGLPNLRHLVFEIPPKVTIFENLQLLVLSECHNLYVLPPRVAKRLIQLKKMQISRCEKMEEIVLKDDDKEVEETMDKIVFLRLRELELQYMPNLGIFYGGMYAIEMPLLRFLKLKECRKMECLTHGSLHTEMLERVEINGSSFSVTKDINATMKGLKKGKL